ncbi:MAG: hypothetical protein ABI844_09580 [Saprospiraceae bacterium]
MSNLESTFREKSGEILVKPSENAWDRLESKLSRKHTFSFRSLKVWAIAASFAGMVAISMIWLYQSQATSETISYVAQTRSIDFSNLDNGEILAQINTLHQAYLKLHN